MFEVHTTYGDTYVVENWKVYNGLLQFLYLGHINYHIPLTSINYIKELPNEKK